MHQKIAHDQGVTQINLNNQQEGGRLRTQLNFLSLITEGDESQNIRLFNGDVVNVDKNPTVLREQLPQAGLKNFTPYFLQGFVSGLITQPEHHNAEKFAHLLDPQLWKREEKIFS